MKSGSFKVNVYPAIVGLTAIVFILDLLTPVGYAVWLLYLVPLLLTIWTPQRWYSLVLAAILTVLVVAGFLLSPPGINPRIAIFNRSVGVSVLWISAILLTKHKKAQDALRESEQLLLADLVAMNQLHAVGAIYLGKGDLQQTFDMLVESAMTITGADMGNLQLLDPASGDLRIRAQRGFDPAWVDFWNNAYTGKGACHTALERGERVIVEDVTTSAIFVGTPALVVQLKAGVRAVQSTPLVSRSGKALGMFSTHFKTPHRPSERSLKLLDLLARQSADIIERAEAEASIRENHDRLLLAMRTARMGSWASELNTGRFEADEAAMALHGFGPGEVITGLEEGSRHIHPDDAVEIQRLFEHAILTRGTYENEYRVVLPDGSIRWIYSVGRVPEGSSYLIGMVIDITERKKVEEALREREHLLSESQRLAHIGSWGWDLTGPIRWTNETYRIYGVSPETFTPSFESFVSLLHPDDRPAMQRWLEACMAGQSPDDLEFRIVLSDGSVRLLSGRGELIYDTEKRPVYMAGTVQDITERKKMEQELIESERRYRTLAEAANDLITLVDHQGQIKYANQHTARYFDKLPQEIIGKNLADIFPRNIAARQQSNLQKVFQSGEPLYVEAPTVFPGGVVWLGTWLSPIKNSTGGVDSVLVVSRNITERKWSEDELRRGHLQLRLLAQKLSEAEESERRRLSIELHDRIGQNLTAIGLNLDILRTQLTDRPESALSRINDSIGLLEQTTERARALIGELRPPVLDDYGLLAALKWHAKSFSERTGIKVDIQGAEFSPRLKQEEESVLFRIVQEALTNVSKHAHATQVTLTVEEVDGKGRLIISDNGTGFEPSDLSREERTQGWGIMNMTERAQMAGGSFRIESSTGHGTSVIVELPR